MKTQERLKTTAITFSILILFYGNRVISDDKNQWSCRESNVNELLQIDCSGFRKEIEVPNTLNRDVQILNLSNNVLLEITEESFALYTKLVQLDMSRCSRSVEFKKFAVDKCFLPLTKLEFLDVSRTCFLRTSNPRPRFPKTIKEFGFEGCSQSYDLDLSDLESLERVRCKQAWLRKFPIFHKNAPLRSLDVRKCDLNRATYEQIAFLCQLNEVLFDYADGSGLHSSKNYCGCLMLNKWLVETKVTMPNKLNCSKPAPNADCDTVFTYEAVEGRRQCLNRMNIMIPAGDPSEPGAPSKPPKSGRWLSPLLIGLIAVVLLMVIALLLAIFWFKRKKKKENSAAVSPETEWENDEHVEEEQSENEWRATPEQEKVSG